MCGMGGMCGACPHGVCDLGRAVLSLCGTCVEVAAAGLFGDSRAQADGAGYRGDAVGLDTGMEGHCNAEAVAACFTPVAGATRSAFPVQT